MNAHPGDGFGLQKPMHRGITGAVAVAICVCYFTLMVPCRLLPQNHYYNMQADAFRAAA